ncbi:MAG: F0F1 ATP synthase subunit A [Parcubacteria group bacterium]|nr:F0F1 ATP synthase subunit A [Parcubacteria group bacterium]
MDIHISLKPEIIAHLAGIPISNSLILSLLTALLLCGAGFFAVRRLQRVPGRIQNGAEIVVDGILDFMAQTLGNREQAKKFFPLIATIFLFVLLNNWIGLVPGVGSFGIYEMHEGERAFVPFFRSANSDLNSTLALTLVTMIAIQLYGIRQLGFLRHLSKFFTFTKGPIYFFVGILELIAEFAKVLSFSFRLFGNIFAGEVLLVIIMTLVPLVAPFPFLLLELFVGLVQALVFSMLAMIFARMATETAH